MKKTIGLILIALGIVAFVLQGISYTTQEKIVDVGPLEVTTEKENTIPLPPLLGGIALIGGIFLIATSKKS